MSTSIKCWPWNIKMGGGPMMGVMDWLSGKSASDSDDHIYEEIGENVYDGVAESESDIYEDPVIPKRKYRSYENVGKRLRSPPRHIYDEVSSYNQNQAHYDYQDTIPHKVHQHNAQRKHNAKHTFSNNEFKKKHEDTSDQNMNKKTDAKLTEALLHSKKNRSRQKKERKRPKNSNISEIEVEKISRLLKNILRKSQKSSASAESSDSRVEQLPVPVTNRSSIQKEMEPSKVPMPNQSDLPEKRREPPQSSGPERSTPNILHELNLPEIIDS